jgi:tetratricopeptide (TPR) repeat protein
MSLAKPGWRWAIFAFTLIVFLAVGISSGRVLFADQMESSSQPAEWLRAAQLEPGNGDYWFKLGLNRQWDLDNTDSTQTINYFLRAVAIDPRSATYWTELAGAYETANQVAAARQAYQKALDNYPASSEVHWRYGSFLIRQGEIGQGYAEIHLALRIDPKLIPLAISRVWPATQDVGALLSAVLPDTEDAQSQALDWFCSEKLTDPALAVWKHMVAASRPIPIQAAFPLEDVLLETFLGDEARQVWREAVIASGNPAEVEAGNSLVFNGGFEYDATDGGLGWHIERMLGVKYDYDTSDPHEGKRALRMSFDGAQNLSFQGVWQLIPVEPNTRYHFEGYLRTSGITTDSGIRFLIYFLGPTQSQQPSIILDNFTGDHPWEAQRADFTTGADVHVLRVTMYRPPSQRFSNKLAGIAWVDDVSLTAAGPSHPIP